MKPVRTFKVNHVYYSPDADALFVYILRYSKEVHWIESSIGREPPVEGIILANAIHICEL